MSAYSRPEERERAVKAYFQETLERLLSEEPVTQKEYRLPVLHLSELYKEISEETDEDVFTVLSSRLSLLYRGWSAEREFFSDRPDLALLYMKVYKNLDFHNSNLRFVSSLFDKYRKISKSEKEINYMLSGGAGSLARNLSQKNFSRKRVDSIVSGSEMVMNSVSNATFASIFVPTEARNEGLKVKIRKASNPTAEGLKSADFTTYMKAKEIRKEEGIKHLAGLNTEDLFLEITIPSGVTQASWSALTYNCYLIFDLMGDFLKTRQKKEQTLNKAREQGASPEEIRALRGDFNKELHSINEDMKVKAGWSDPSYSKLKANLGYRRRDLRDMKETVSLLLEDSIFRAFQETQADKVASKVS